MITTLYINTPFSGFLDSVALKSIILRVLDLVLNSLSRRRHNSNLMENILRSF
jgi:hypothetical protein